MFARLADWLILKPSTHPIAADGKSRRVIEYAGGSFEAWVEPANGDGQREPDVFILKFSGTGGRAERASVHPADAWPDLSAEVWAVNPPGYGTSGGRASLQSIAAVASAAFDAIDRVSGGRPVLVTGNSLGSIAAIYVAARHNISGLLLRNPPPLRQLLAGHYGRWNFGASRFIARHVPADLCAIENAARTTAPAVFIMSGQDRTVPLRYQQQIIDAHQGQSQILLLDQADHASPMADAHLADYAEKLDWLRQLALANSGK